jgi:hypothetical protein
MFGKKSEEANIAAQELMANGINSGKLDVIYDMFAPNVVDHDPAPDQGPEPEGFMRFFTTLRRAFPDLSVKPNHMVTD